MWSGIIGTIVNGERKEYPLRVSCTTTPSTRMKMKTSQPLSQYAATKLLNASAAQLKAGWKSAHCHQKNNLSIITRYGVK